jgi:hypothetical protein
MEAVTGISILISRPHCSTYTRPPQHAKPCPPVTLFGVRILASPGGNSTVIPASRSRPRKPPGAHKIRERLLRRFCGIPVPAKCTIHAVLDRHGLVERRGRVRRRARGHSALLRQEPQRSLVHGFQWAVLARESSLLLPVDRNRSSFYGNLRLNGFKAGAALRRWCAPPHRWRFRWLGWIPHPEPRRRCGQSAAERKSAPRARESPGHRSR